MWSACVVGVLVLQSVVMVAGTSVCEHTANPSAMFYVKSHRNLTGQWVTETSLVNFAQNQLNEGENGTGAWQMDVAFCSSKCGRENAFQMTVVVTRSPLVNAPLTHIIESAAATIHVSSKRHKQNIKKGLRRQYGKPAGYKFYKGVGYYKFHPELTTWPKALAACEAEGAHLAIINSEREADVIRGLFQPYIKYNTAYAHIGFHEVNEEGNFSTIFGDPLNSTGYTKWDSGEPNNKDLATGEDCGTVHGHFGTLNDVSCLKNNSFICEIEI